MDWRGDEGTAWGDDNVLYLDMDLLGGYICTTEWDIGFVYFIVSKSYLIRK